MQWLLAPLMTVIIWGFATFVKYYLIKERERRRERQFEKKVQEDLKKYGVPQHKIQEALKRFQDRLAKEQQEKNEKSRGKTLVEEVEERIREKKKKKEKRPISENKYNDPELFEDDGSRLYKELVRKGEYRMPSYILIPPPERDIDIKNFKKDL